MLKKDLDALKEAATIKAKNTNNTYYVLSNKKVVAANGFIIDPLGLVKIEAIVFPPRND